MCLFLSGSEIFWGTRSHWPRFGSFGSLYPVRGRENLALSVTHLSELRQPTKLFLVPVREIKSVFLSLGTVVQMHVWRRLSYYFVCATQTATLGLHGVANQKCLSCLHVVDIHIVVLFIYSIYTIIVFVNVSNFMYLCHFLI